MADFDDIAEATPHPRYRVPLGMPMRDDGRRAGAIVSVVVREAVAEEFHSVGSAEALTAAQPMPSSG